ncbi:MAG: nucleotidyltransferase family protein [Pseudanabaenaceae cyanobacterium]
MELLPQLLKNIQLLMEKIKAFYDRWQITEFVLFSSVLQDDFRPDSDIGVLYVFDNNAKHRLFDLVAMKEELESL